MNEIKVNISFEKRILKLEGIKLVSGDYNSTKVVFTFDKEYVGKKIFELAKPDTDKAVFVQEIKNNEVILVAKEDGVEKSIFSEEGKYPFEISLYGENSKITSMGGKLSVLKEMVVVGDEIVEQYMPIFDELINEINKNINDLEAIKEKVQEAENNRKDEEKARQEAENNRKDEEKARQEAENNRKDEEKARQEAENNRKDEEKARQEAENLRVCAEQTRSDDENKRIFNETMRQKKYKMIDSALKDVFIEGKNLHIGDSANWFIKTKVKGETKQEGEPSPDYPSEIENVDNVEISVTRNNILKGLSTPKDDTSYWSSVHKYDNFTPLEDGWGRFSCDNSEGTSTIYISTYVKLSAINLKPNTLYSLIAEIRNSNISENSGAFFIIQTANIAAAWKESKSIGYTAINNGGVYKYTATTKDDFTGVERGLDSYLRLAKGTSGTIEIRLSVIEGDYDITDFEYEEYKSQTETFSLAEGQKLYEGSYLADDGIHNKFRELSLAIADMNNSETYPGWTNLTQLKEDYPSQNTRLDRLCNNAYCNITKNKEAIIVNTKGLGVLCLATNGFGLTQTEWKEQYPDLVFNLQYELPEEEIIPYTEEQQEAWNKIKELYTYKNITNITSTSELEIIYKKDLQMQIEQLQALIETSI